MCYTFVLIVGFDSVCIEGRRGIVSSFIRKTWHVKRILLQFLKTNETSKYKVDVIRGISCDSSAVIR